MRESTASQHWMLKGRPQKSSRLRSQQMIKLALYFLFKPLKTFKLRPNEHLGVRAFHVLGILWFPSQISELENICKASSEQRNLFLKTLRCGVEVRIGLTVDL